MMLFADRGECEIGSIFRIESIADLQKNTNVLDCIWNSGEMPLEIPVGKIRGTLLKMGPKNGIIPKLINLVYTGDTIKYNEETDSFLGPVEFLNIGLSCAEWYLGEYGGPYPSLETFIDGGLVMDFKTQKGLESDVDCYPFVKNDSFLKYIPFTRSGNIPPVNQFTDIVKTVGATDDGRPILLGRTIFTGFRTEFNRPFTAWWFVLVPETKSINVPQFDVEVTKPISWSRYGLDYIFNVMKYSLLMKNAL